VDIATLECDDASFKVPRQILKRYKCCRSAGDRYLKLYCKSTIKALPSKNAAEYSNKNNVARYEPNSSIFKQTEGDSETLLILKGKP
jgi:hypothetical protein